MPNSPAQHQVQSLDETNAPNPVAPMSVPAEPAHEDIRCGNVMMEKSHQLDSTESVSLDYGVHRKYIQ